MTTGELKQTISDAVDSKIRYVELSERHAFVCTDASLSVFERTTAGMGTETGREGERAVKRVLRLQDFAGVGPIYRILLPEMPRMAEGCMYGGEGDVGEGRGDQTTITPKMAIVPQKLEGIYATNVITQEDGYYAGMYTFLLSHRWTSILSPSIL